MEENQETVGAGSLAGVLGFPWEGDSNEGGKTFLLQRSAAEETVRSSRCSELQVTSGVHPFEVSRRSSPGDWCRSAYSHRPQTQPRSAILKTKAILLTVASNGSLIWFSSTLLI